MAREFLVRVLTGEVMEILRRESLRMTIRHEVGTIHADDEQREHTAACYVPYDPATHGEITFYG